MKILFTTIVILYSSLLSGQNLIDNGDFEEYNSCPINYSKRYTKYFIPGWESATTGTPDVYNTCSKTGAGVPYNWSGVSAAKSGSGYVGILVFGHHEFIKTTLLEPLARNRRYVYSFYYKLSSYSTVSIDRISTRFGGDTISEPYTNDYIKEKSLDNRTGSWELVVDTISAIGGEDYLIIGNFDNSDRKTKSTSLFFRKGLEEMLDNHAYFYIDNVRLELLESPTVIPDELIINKVYTFKNILFEFDEAILVDSTISELNDLGDHLIKNPELVLEVFGHTDESGSAEYNMDLSIKRARSVVNYLKSYGINEGRMQFIGYGETKPVFNTSGEYEAANRRVEFVLGTGKQ